MNEAGRVLAGTLAAAVLGFALVAILAAGAMFFDTSDMDAEAAIGGAVYLMIIYAVVGIPAAVLGCAVVFGTTYLVLRGLGMLNWLPFPLAGVAVFIAVGLWDSQGPLFSSAESIAVFFAIVITGAATGSVFWWFAKPPRPSTS